MLTYKRNKGNEAQFRFKLPAKIYIEIMAGAITFIMEVESYTEIYYDYITRTIRDLLFHISLQLPRQAEYLRGYLLLFIQMADTLKQLSYL